MCVWWVLETVGELPCGSWRWCVTPPPIVTVGKDRFQRVFGWLEGCLLDIQVDMLY